VILGYLKLPRATRREEAYIMHTLRLELRGAAISEGL
jgi:hypothetical protein